MNSSSHGYIEIQGAAEHNLKNINLSIERNSITVITGVSGSGKSSLAFDTVYAEAQRRFFHTLSFYSRQFIDIANRPQVKKVSGILPPIGLRQNETQPSRLAKVGTLTDVSELLGVLYARFGVKRCPKHGTPTAAQSAADIVTHLLSQHPGRILAIGAPLAQEKKGSFSQRLDQIQRKGYQTALIDGKLLTLSPKMALDKDHKHSIIVVVDYVRVRIGGEARLLRSIESALEEADGYGVCYLTDSEGTIDQSSAQHFSNIQGCPTCGYSWPKLDSRHFSANSLGRCKSCKGYGIISDENSDGSRAEFEHTLLNEIQAQCEACSGTGVKPDMRPVQVMGLSIQEVMNKPLSQLAAMAIEHWPQLAALNAALDQLLAELSQRIEPLVKVGLGYLSLARAAVSLSAGEAQRLKLSGVLSSKLCNVLYVLDEPSQGLHQREVLKLCETLKSLRDRGNTIIVVDHDESIMRNADSIVDLGPGGGEQGGELMAHFSPPTAALFQNQSRTAFHLAKKSAGAKPISSDFDPSAFITIIEPRLFNLRLNEAKIPLNAMTVVAGVSGAGKSSLILAILAENLARRVKDPSLKPNFCQAIHGAEGLNRLEVVDRRPIAKSSVSMPATYLDVMGELRKLYGGLTESQLQGLSAKSFSLTAGGGRCEVCSGRGELSIEVRFLNDMRAPCPQCQGRRFQSHIESVRYRGLSFSDVLALSLSQVVQEFSTFKKVVTRLQSALDLGLGYLKFGQSSASLSGGESQRLKLASFFNQSLDKHSMLILDEPTTGLHFDDVERLIKGLKQLVARGVTVVLVEHNQDILNAADWLIELGPGAAEEGGSLVFQGKPRL